MKIIQDPNDPLKVRAVTAMNPANVPELNDLRFREWDNLAPSNKQLAALDILLNEEGVNPADLYGEGFTSVRELSRWACSWGITFLKDAQDARYTQQAMQRMERDDEEMREMSLKSYIANYYRAASHE